jgi:AcrR family transcriptional regulator
MARYQAGLRTEARIVDATRSLLSEGGLEAATLAAICDRAEVKAGSFYNLFDSKEAVVLRVVREAIEAIDPDPDAAGTDTVDDLVNAYVRFFEEDSELARVYVLTALQIEGGKDAGIRFLRHHQRRVERFAAAMSRGDTSLTDAEATIQAELLLGALDGLAFRWSLDTRFAFADFAARAAKAFS